MKSKVWRRRSTTPRGKLVGPGDRRGLDIGRTLRSRVTPGLTSPASVRGPASDSLAKAMEVANKPGPQGNQLAELSNTAFLTALHAFTIALALIVAVVPVGLRAPGRDGQQLRIVRRLIARLGEDSAGRHRT